MPKLQPQRKNHYWESRALVRTVTRPGFHNVLLRSTHLSKVGRK
jgi:hypothetical protein